MVSRAADLLAARPGASMGEIATSAGVSRATLHRRFHSREALVRAIAETALARLSAITDEISAEGLTGRAAIERILERGVALAPRFGFLASEQCVRDDVSLNAAIETIFDVWVRWFEEGQRRGELRVDVPARWVVACVDALVLAAAEGVRSGVVAPRDALRLVRLTLFEGVASSPCTIAAAASAGSAVPASPSHLASHASPAGTSGAVRDVASISALPLVPNPPHVPTNSTPARNLP